jgi:hypothetical protein
MAGIKHAAREQIPSISETDKSWKASCRRIIDHAWLDSMVLSEWTNGLRGRYDNKISEFSIATENGTIVGAAVFGKSFTD